MPDDNKALFQAFMNEAFVKHNAEAANDFFAADYVDHNPFPRTQPTASGFKEGLENLLVSFPDLHIHVDGLVSEGDQLAARIAWHGTQSGKGNMGTRNTGKPASVSGIHMFRFKEGKAIEHWAASKSTWM